MAEITQKLGFDAQGAINTLDKLTAALGKANTALGAMNTSASGAKALDKVEKGTKKATKAADDFTVSWKTIIRVLQTQLIVRGLNTLISGLKEGIENARELGLAIEEVRTIDALGRTAEDINNAVLDLSDAIGQAPTDLAEGLYQTLSNQVVGAAESFEFMAEAARLAKVTASETGDAVNALSSVMNSYSLASSEAEHVAGTLFATVEQGRLRLSEIANVIGRVTPLTAKLGITWEETAASIATMTRQGVRADTAITQLRAVVTRLLKPTAEMSAIFRKWGVEDGRQAIQTFGGLSGVLKKLAQETGHNSGEMAELLRNVRAIAGVFGIMNDEGKTMEEVLGHITEGTKKATEAWKEFSESDAQKLTVKMQEFDNLLTRVGNKSLPAVTYALEVINANMRAFGLGIDVLTGGWKDADVAADSYARAVAAGAKEGIELQKKQADLARGAYDVLTEAARKHYAEANKLENQLADTRDNAIKSSTAVFSNAVDNLSNLYKESLTEIQQFADNAAGNVEKTLERIAGIQQSIEDRTLEYRLRQAQGFNDKILILNKALLDAKQKQDEAAAKISADPKSEEAFIKASEKVLDIAEQREALGKKENVSGAKKLELFLDVVQAEKDQASGLERSAAASQAVADNASKWKKEFSEAETRIQAILDRIDEIHDDEGIISPDEKAELITLGAEYDKLKAKMEKGIDVLSGFGLDIDFNVLVDGMTDALNQAHKDWAAEVNRAKAEFAKAVFPIKLSLDPGGELAGVQKAAKLTQIPGESEGAFAARTDLAAQEALKKEREIVDKINASRAAGLKPLKDMRSSLNAIAVQDRKSVANVQARTEAAATFPFGVVTRANEAGLKADRGRLMASQSLQTTLTGISTTLQKEAEIKAGTLEAARQEIDVAEKIFDISKQRADLYREVLDQLEQQVKRNKELRDLEATRPDSDLVKAGRALLEVRKDMAEATELEKKQQEAIKQRMIEQTTEAGKTTTAVSGTANAAEKTANATGNSADQAGTLSVKSGLATIALGFAAVASNAVANNLERAAKAAANIGDVSVPTGAGATAYHGGTHYADGGMFRGQDRQLTALARGETVVNRKQSRKFFSELNAMNQGSQPVYRDQGGPVTNVGDVNVTVQGGDSSQQTVREIGHALRREMKRGNLTLR